MIINFDYTKCIKKNWELAFEYLWNLIKIHGMKQKNLEFY